METSFLINTPDETNEIIGGIRGLFGAIATAIEPDPIAIAAADINPVVYLVQKSARILLIASLNSLQSGLAIRSALFRKLLLEKLT